jgi:geranylgeranylglycerol-phosphate geranylgeranyltransferase
MTMGANTAAAPSRGPLDKLKIYWRFARPFTLLPPLLGMISGAITGIGALAHHAGQGFFEYLQGDGRLASLSLFILMGSLMAANLNAASNILNQLYDLENDKINKPSRPLPAGEVTERETRILYWVLYALSLVAAWFVKPLSGDSLATRECFWIVLVAAIITYIYSAPPYRTKRWGWAAQFTIAVPRGMLLKVCGWSCVAGVFSDLEPWYIGFVFFLFLLGAAATKDFADMKGDEAANCITLPIRYGVKSAAYQISPFFIIPWIFLPLGAHVFQRADGTPVLSGHPIVLTSLGVFLTLYGMYTVYLILRDPESLATTENHPSWTHMYRMMMVAQVGFAAAYMV